MVQHVDDAGVAAIICTVRGNVYQYFENQLQVEHSWEAHQVKEFQAIWGTRRLIIVLILFTFLALKILFIQFFIVLLQNVLCRTSCGWSYPSLGHPYTKEFCLLVCKTCIFKIFVQDKTNRHTQILVDWQSWLLQYRYCFNNFYSRLSADQYLYL